MSVCICDIGGECSDCLRRLSAEAIAREAVRPKAAQLTEIRDLLADISNKLDTLIDAVRFS